MSRISIKKIFFTALVLIPTLFIQVSQSIENYHPTKIELEPYSQPKKVTDYKHRLKYHYKMSFEGTLTTFDGAKIKVKDGALEFKMSQVGLSGIYSVYWVFYRVIYPELGRDSGSKTRKWISYEEYHYKGGEGNSSDKSISIWNSRQDAIEANPPIDWSSKGQKMRILSWRQKLYYSVYLSTDKRPFQINDLYSQLKSDSTNDFHSFISGVRMLDEEQSKILEGEEYPKMIENFKQLTIVKELTIKKFYSVEDQLGSINWEIIKFYGGHVVIWMSAIAWIYFKLFRQSTFEKVDIGFATKEL